jgi:hypothetical protein
LDQLDLVSTSVVVVIDCSLRPCSCTNKPSAQHQHCVSSSLQHGINFAWCSSCAVGFALPCLQAFYTLCKCCGLTQGLNSIHLPNLCPAGEPQGVRSQQFQAAAEGHCAAGSARQGPLRADAHWRRQEPVLPGSWVEVGGRSWPLRMFNRLIVILRL